MERTNAEANSEQLRKYVESQEAEFGTCTVCGNLRDAEKHCAICNPPNEPPGLDKLKRLKRKLLNTK
ncbi:MAG: hypothetical protein Q8P83_01780 [bacterium]|nr:hypothetical protein [bacterium]